MKAIESGVFSNTIQTRIKDLEEEEMTLKGKIEAERASIPTVTRNQIIYYMESFKDGDINDPAFQKSLFDGFLEAAYLYDDRLKIVFNYTKGENEIDLPIELDDLESSTVESSFNASSAPPLAAETNSLATIAMIGRVFVLTVYFDQ